MTGPLNGLQVLDLTRGMAGAVTTMLLADSGAAVTRVERPGDAPWVQSPAWGRGKRTVAIDLSEPGGHARFLEMVAEADVLVESSRPGVTTRLGIDFPTLHSLHPALVYCSITGYGRGTADEHRPGYESLVSARTGTQWEQQSGLFRSGSLGPPPVEMPPGADQSARPGEPVFSALPWLSLPAAYQAVLGISAALVVRQHTGEGQWVETSLLQGSLCGRIQVEDGAPEGFDNWTAYEGAPWGLFQCGDGRWVHHWPLKPLVVVVAAECGDHGGPLVPPPPPEHRRVDPRRVGNEPHAIVEVLHYYPQLVEAFAKYPSDQWLRWAEAAGDGIQLVRSPAEVLNDAGLLAEESVVELVDPAAGAIRVVGRAVDSVPAGTTASLSISKRDRPPHPLDGVTVLDLGTAVAGPFAAGLLADLGARVIKVNTPWDRWWMASSMSHFANRGKQSLPLDLATVEGREVLYRWVNRADVLVHNLRQGVAERLGFDARTLRQHNRALVYCHVRGFGRGPSSVAGPATDQTAAALSGQEWQDGGCSRGGRPFYSATSLGDTGAGYLAAMAVVQALFDRHATGVTRDVTTSLLNASMLSASVTYLERSSNTVRGPQLDGRQLGVGALHRLYRTGDGWLCLAALHDADWDGLRRVMADPELDHERFSNRHDRHDDELAAVLERLFAGRSAETWCLQLEAEGVPCEVSRATAPGAVFSDPELRRRGWITSYRHGEAGMVSQHGTLIDLSATPLRIWGPAPVFGEHAVDLLREVGYSDSEVAALLKTGAAGSQAATV